METTKETCPIGSMKSHEDHDSRIQELEDAERICKKTNESQRKTIMELEAFKKYAEMAPRVLAERVIRLEKALKTLANRYTKIGGKL